MYQDNSGNRLHTASLTLRTPLELISIIDDWRANQRPILNRSEAIRVLVLKGIEKDSVLPKK